MVYPRLRGGSCLQAGRDAWGGGLSPPTRGIRHLGMANIRRLRSIPAYAGDPGRPSVRSDTKRVYPRLRGGSPDRPLA